MLDNTASEPNPQEIIAQDDLSEAKKYDTREYRHGTGCHKSIQQQFAEFHALNPEIYHLFVQFARQAKAAGHEVYGVKSLLERIRWHVRVELQKYDDFKINNSFSPYYARKVMENNPDLEGFFEIRVLRAK